MHLPVRSIPDYDMRTRGILGACSVPHLTKGARKTSVHFLRSAWPWNNVNIPLAGTAERGLGVARAGESEVLGT